MDNPPLMEEKASYGVLLYRKNRTMRFLESILFLVGLGLLLLFFQFRSLPFITGAALLALAVLGLTPLLYKALAQPSYILYKDRLVIQMGQKEESIPLTEIENDYDLPYIYHIRNTVVPLLVSNEFLDQLNLRLEVIKRGWKI